jgi:predicted ArsR family transcriptional regulator
MPENTSDLLKEKRTEIIHLLRARGAMTVDHLAVEMKLTKVGIRRHLETLEKHGYVHYRTEWRERGRPCHVYSLTEKAEDLFPKTYDALAKEVLRFTKQCFGERGVLKVINARADETLAHLRPQFEGLSFHQRVEKLAEFLVSRGYLAEYHALPDGSYQLIERNCPTIAVAYEFPQLCQQEKCLYAELLGGEIIREQRIAGGDRVCAYRVFPPSNSHSINTHGGETNGKNS